MNSMQNKSQHLYIGIAFWLLLLFTAWLYFPGLQSNFILDDEINLQSLEEFDNPFSHDALRFILEGKSSSLGRPLSLASFALQAYQWPNPASFKYINLLIHLFNAALIFWMLIHVCRLMKLPEQQSLWLALLTTAVWILHPFHVSTTLYVVQRMAQLGVLFTLLGLLGYLIGRIALDAQRIWSGLLWMSVSVGAGIVLGVLSKETAILLTLYILVLEFTLLHQLNKNKIWYLWAAVFLFLPLFLLASYFALTWSNMLEAYKIRDFTLEQRLMTETRVLWDYIDKILLPSPNRFSIFHDDWTISSSLLQPMNTLWSALGLLLLFSLALWKRQQWAVFAFAVLWFIAGHSLEGSIIPLKLYFEHRNYLPLLGLAFALVYLFYRLLTTPIIQLKIKRLLLILPLFWLMSLPLVTWMEVELWQRPLTQAALWAELKPHSAYAQSHYASQLNTFGQHTAAIEIYQTMGDTLPNDVGPYLLWLNTHCYKPELPIPDSNQLRNRLRTTEGDEAFGVALNILIESWEEKVCPSLLNTHFLEEEIFQPLLNNHELAKLFRNVLYHNYAKFQAKQGNYLQAIDYADKALAIEYDIKMKIERIHWLLSAGRVDIAQVYIEEVLLQMNFKDYYLHSDYLKSLSVVITELNAMQNREEHNE